jgi:hypothetical protein
VSAPNDVRPRNLPKTETKAAQEGDARLAAAALDAEAVAL